MKEKKKETVKKGNLKNILIVGDWFVDEHWVTGVHRSSTSSRRGEAHFRSLHQIDSAVQSFCGAGKVASLLYNIEGEQFFIYGAGLWHNDDTEILEEMLDSKNLIGKNMFRLNHGTPKRPDRVKLFNLYNLVKPEEKDNISTTRIIRIYNLTGSKEVHSQRLDWEIRRESDQLHPYPEKLEKRHLEAIKKLKNVLEERNDNTSLDAIIIKDMCKGVISPDLIRILARYFSKAHWFVSTKAWNPEWYEELKKVSLRLLLIPQVPAQEAIRKGDLCRWVTRAGYPGENAIQLIKELHERVGLQSNPEIIVLPNQFSVLAYSPDFSGDNCVVQTIARQKELIVDMGMASAFLPAIVSLLLKPQKMNLKNLLTEALQATYDWVKFDGERVLNPGKGWAPTTKQFMDKNSYNKTSHGDYKFKTFNLENEKKEWEMAMKNIGIISIGSELPYFDLTRAMVEVDGYACCGEKKRQEIGKLIRGIQSFLKTGEKHHISCMLTASPGSGKTFLVRRLAETSDLRFLPFNITQMTSRNDILEIFDSIVTTQAQDPNKPLLVFVDEINAKLAGDNVYSSFLAPIEDGVYIRGGKPFHIDPCIWVFSGTNEYAPSNHKKSNEKEKDDKESDFVSRLSLGILDVEKRNDAFRKRIENVYIGVSLILMEYPDVRYITDKVLTAFHDMPKKVRVRELKHFVKSFKDIQYGEVWAKNVPVESFSRFDGFDKKGWEDVEEKRKVEIRS